MLTTHEVKYPPQNGNRFWITAKCYTRPSFKANENDDDALTLIFLHATSLHKETWEPTIDALFDLVEQNKPRVKIREAWALDCPNHGVSAQLNESILLEPEFYLNFTCEKYAECVQHFLTAGTERGARVDFRKRKLVGIGHSLGGCTISLLQSIDPSLPFSSIILVEPMVSPNGEILLHKLRDELVRGAYERQDVWRTREHAEQKIRSRGHKSRWDPTVVRLFVEYGIRPHPGRYSMRSPYRGFTLACTRDQEAAMYRDPIGATKPIASIDKYCHVRPTHLILGTIHDFIPAPVHEALIDPSSGRRFASITKLPRTGHMVPQNNPAGLANAILKNLLVSQNWKQDNSSSLPSTKSKL